MNLKEYKIEMKEIMNSRVFRNLSKEKKKDYRSWLYATMQHTDRYQHVIHKIKYKLGILRTQLEEEE